MASRVVSVSGSEPRNDSLKLIRSSSSPALGARLIPLNVKVDGSGEGGNGRAIGET